MIVHQLLDKRFSSSSIVSASQFDPLKADCWRAILHKDRRSVA
jgi:hypothetical protein